MNYILVTGGAGYIGSHTCLELIEEGYNVIAIDNLVNGKIQSLKEIEKIVGRTIPFFNIDLRNTSILKQVFNQFSISSVIHFAGYKAVSESVRKPLLYFSNNLSASISLFNVIEEYGVNKIVFSSSCTVYGKPKTVPVKETNKLDPVNPYGRSKLMVEEVLHDFFKANQNLSVSVLRYFNPIGAHSSGNIGEDPKGTPNNLLPYISKVALGKIDKLSVFGDDYNTSDGTGVRDYIHVVDLAKAHVCALKKINKSKSVFDIYNLGTGKGYSVLEIIKEFEQASGKKVHYEITERRPGDVDKIYADPTKANKRLGWNAEKSLKKMCEDIWNWQSKNPNGYEQEI